MLESQPMTVRYSSTQCCSRTLYTLGHIFLLAIFVCGLTIALLNEIIWASILMSICCLLMGGVLLLDIQEYLHELP
jgi:hypothetical protein